MEGVGYGSVVVSQRYCVGGLVVVVIGRGTVGVDLVEESLSSIDVGGSGVVGMLNFEDARERCSMRID